MRQYFEINENDDIYYKNLLATAKVVRSGKRTVSNQSPQFLP